MFDPYRKWLGIPKDQRPPTHYQLLGLAEGEDDADVIEEAAIRQTAHVRTYQIGPHAKECTRILNEISKARTVLLNPAKKKEYDAQLAKKKTVEKSSEQVKATAPPPRPAAFEVLDDEPVVKVADRKKTLKPVPVIAKEGVFLSKGMLYGIAGGGAGGVLLLVLLLVLLRGGSTPPEPAKTPLVGPPIAIANPNKGKEAVEPVKKKEGFVILPPAIDVVAKKNPEPGPIVNNDFDGPRFVGGKGIDAEPAQAGDALAELGEGEIIYRATPPARYFASFAMSPDGRRIAVGESGEIKIIEVEPRKLWSLGKASGRVIAWSPNGKILGLVSPANLVLVDAASGGIIQSIPHSQVWAMSFSNDGKSVLTATPGRAKEVDKKVVLDGANVCLWDVATGKLKTSIPITEQGNARRVGFAPDGALWSEHATSRFFRWAPDSGQQLEEHSFISRSSRMTEDGKFHVGVETGAFSKGRLWNAKTGASLRQSEPIKDVLDRFAATPDGRLVLILAAAGRERVRMHIWNSSTNALQKSATLPAVSHQEIAPDGRFAFTSHQDGALRLWRLEGPPLDKAGKEDAKPFAPPVKAPPPFPMDDNVRGPGTDRNTKLYTELGPLAFGAAAPDGKHLLLFGGSNPPMRLVDMETGALVRTFNTKGHNVNSARFVNGGKQVLAADFDPRKRTVFLFNVTGEEVARTSEAGKYETKYTAMHPDGTRVLIGTMGSARVWNTKTGAVLYLSPGPKGPGALTPDGSLVVAADEAGTVRCWEFATGKQRKNVIPGDSTNPVRNLRVSHDGNWLLLAYRNNDLKLFDLKRGAFLRSFDGQLAAPTTLAFSSDDSLVATGDHSGTVRLWERSSGALKWSKRVQTDGMRTIWSLSFAMNDRCLLMGGACVRLVDWQAEKSGAGAPPPASPGT